MDLIIQTENRIKKLREQKLEFKRQHGVFSKEIEKELKYLRAVHRFILHEKTKLPNW
ncbi:hypothetical protein SP15_200 [Bacillus phage SP-15]|uniref:Uncharacterized protein n=1 Tax=Bacillus phage SP-15 TaxID=1792032 RepID=A0A127AWL8_9CAUD|nr:hypothetical protein SP15_200 [Bacillus phage SP-15]AMM45000.1 hypothetical protein SP15_200 [Bacillus phage SP-15]